MRIRNEGKRTFYFNGGSIAPSEVVELKDKAISLALIKCYPNELKCLEDLPVRVIEKAGVAEIEDVCAEKEDVVEKPQPKKAPSKKGGKKSKRA